MRGHRLKTSDYPEGMSRSAHFSEPKRGFVVLAASCAFGAIFALSVSFLMTPVYRAEAVVSVVGMNIHSDRASGLLRQFEGIAGLAGVGIQPSDDLHAIAILESKRFTENFIVNHGLLKALFSEKWDSSSETWLVDDEKIPTVTDGRKLFERSIRHIDEDPASGLIRIYIDWRNPEQAAAWANMMIEDVNALIRSEVIHQAERSIEYLRNRLETTTLVEIKQAIFPIIEQELKKVTFASIRDEYALRVIDPALAPARDDPLRPNKPLMVAIGFLLGLLLGMTTLVLLHRIAAVEERGDSSAKKGA